MSKIHMAIAVARFCRQHCSTKMPAPRSSPTLRLGYLHGGLATYLPGETLGPRLIVDYELVWILQGRVTYHLPEQDYAAPPGAIILARPGFQERYTWDAKRRTRHAFFHFSIRQRPRDWPAETRWPVCRMMPGVDPARPLFRHVVDEWCFGAGRVRALPPPPIARAVASIIDALLVSPPVGESEPQKPAAAAAEPVQRALGWAQTVLLEKADRDMTLADLSRAAGTSPQHLCRLFAAGPGVGPMQAVRLLRLEKAAALLARSNLSVKQIAAHCGFKSPFHFSRVFRSVYGSSPTHVRHQTAQGAPPPVPRVGLALPYVDRW
jgi:AraC-like DNA-binding protein